MTTPVTSSTTPARPGVVVASRPAPGQGSRQPWFVLLPALAAAVVAIAPVWYLVDRAEYKARLREIGAVFRQEIGHYDIAMSAVEVKGLIEDRAKVEIEVTAVVP